MRKMIATMMLLFAINISNVAADEQEKSSKPTRIEMDKSKFFGDEIERSASFPIIEATLHCSIKAIEVTLYNIGEAEVYIVNSQNQVISSTTVQTDTPTIIDMNVVGTQGTYYIVVMSDKWYAEGQFNL